ncbi:MAG: hypothetical protein AAF182_03850 [Pseudomonadota bacterium]
MKRFKHLKPVIALLIALCFGTNAHAFVSPKRVVIEDRQSARAITIFNSSNKPMVYTFEWKSRAQMPDGKRRNLDEGETVEGYRPAHDYLLFSPRKVVIPPGKFQKVRLLARRENNMEEGEYHSHLLIKPEPLETKKRQEQQKDPNAQDLSQPSVGGKIEVRTFMSIPVFLHHGETKIDFNISDVALSKHENGMDQIDFVINNNSTRSFYSKNEIQCEKADGSQEILKGGTSYVYSEGKSIPAMILFKKDYPTIDECQGVTLLISAHNDFEFKRNEPIQTAKIK